MEKNKGWMIVSIGAIILSIVSLFLPVITYHNSNGITYSYNVVKMLNASDFLNNVMSDDSGRTFQDSTSPIVSYFSSLNADDFLPTFLTVAITVIGVVAIILSFIGIRSMSKQYESAWPFRLTIIGLIGTAIPAIALLIILAVSKKYLNSGIGMGAYVYITPLAMIAAIITVTSRHRLSKEEQRIQNEARQYLKPAGDLPIVQGQQSKYTHATQRQKGNQYGQ